MTHKYTQAYIKEATATNKTTVKGMKSNNQPTITLPAPEIVPDTSS